MKTILVGLVLVSAAMILSGCGSSASSGGDDPAGSGASASNNPPFSCDVHQIEFSDEQHRCATFSFSMFELATYIGDAERKELPSS